MLSNRTFSLVQNQLEQVYIKKKLFYLNFNVCTHHDLNFLCLNSSSFPLLTFFSSLSRNLTLHLIIQYNFLILYHSASCIELLLLLLILKLKSFSPLAFCLLFLPLFTLHLMLSFTLLYPYFAFPTLFPVMGV